jgi:succinate-semialdehyde dehydrogenase/glutarate-semialdehyde dehydrogenase
MEDADLELAVNRCLTSRMINTGQSCIAAKRFIVHDNVYDEFISMYQEKFENLNHGDPLEATTKVGPLANEQILETIEDQVNRSVQQGAELLTGGKRIADKGYFYAPTLLTNVTQEMPVFIEETFGPVTSVMTFERPEQAVKIANSTNFGLGASIWSEDTTHAKRLASEIDAGSVFINELVKSDPRLPFGGIKRSGYGRELGREGIREFVNIKTIWVN